MYQPIAPGLIKRMGENAPALRMILKMPVTMGGLQNKLEIPPTLPTSTPTYTQQSDIVSKRKPGGVVVICAIFVPSSFDNCYVCRNFITWPILHYLPGSRVHI